MSDSSFNTRVAQCPGCGAELQFKVGTSRVVVCDFCHYVVARTDGGGIEGLGQIADVIPTAARLALGAFGRFDGAGFRLVGRVQLQWAQGVWDEWYAAFDDGRWGWLAEAQGRCFMSFAASERPVPAAASLRASKTIFLQGLGRYVVTDVKQAKYVGARGELPETFPLDGTQITFADLSGPDGAFGTLDYSGTPPAIFVGHEVAFEALAINAEHVEQAPRERVEARAMICPNCGGPVPLQMPDLTMRVTCGHCQSLLDATKGALRFLAAVEKPRLRWPLGSDGLFGDTIWRVVGWMQRECVVEGETYGWEEYLLYDPKSGRQHYLLNTDGHWSFVEPIAPGDVEVGTTHASWKGTDFRRFSAVDAVVKKVYGEFPWAVAKGESAHAIDFIAPLHGLSEEKSGNEVTWSHATYLSPAEVWKAFGAKGVPAPARGVGALQPNPHVKRGESNVRFAFLACVAAVGLLVVFLARAGEALVLEQDFMLAPTVVEAAPGTLPSELPQGPAAISFSKSFEIPEGGHNLRAEISSNVNNAWVAVGLALIDETTSEFTEFELASSYYSGSDGEGSWTENERESSEYLAAVPAGKYVLRLAAEWEANQPPPTVRVRLTSGVARFTHFLIVILLLVLGPLLGFMRRNSFEQERWQQATEGDA